MDESNKYPHHVSSTENKQEKPPLPKRKTPRLQGFDYSIHGSYFVTIVTHHQQELFGIIENGEMNLSASGRMILQVWDEMKKVFHTLLYPIITVMPNHVHFIICILDDNKTYLSEVVRWMKSKTTHDYILGVKENGWPHFNGHLWQSRFWDRIIRNQREYDFVMNYIYENPRRWSKDKLCAHCGEETDDINKKLNNHDYTLE